jgi:hypothetical protein
MAGGNSTKSKGDKSDKSDKSDRSEKTLESGKSLEGTSNARNEKALVESITAAIAASMRSGFEEMSKHLESTAYEDYEDEYEYEENGEEPGVEGFDDERLNQEVAA